MRRPLRAGLVILALVLGLAAPAAAEPLFGPTQDPVAGSRVFGAKGCVRCHAIKGAGGRIGPDLGLSERPRSFFDLAAALWNHAPQMSDRMRQLGILRPRIDGRESGDLVAFLFTVDYFERPGDPDKGKRVFSDKRCIACHQAGGVGGVLGPNLDALKPLATPIYLATAMWNHGPQMSEAMQARRVARPTFSGSELRDLLAYLGSVSGPGRDEPVYFLPGNAEDGRRLFAEKRCVNCHGASGRGGLGPDLTQRRLHGSTLDFAAAMWNKAPGMTAAMKGQGIPPVTLQPSEMADIVAYLYSVRYARPGDPRRGVLIAAEKGCLGCHGLGGERGKPAVDLGRARGIDSPGGILAALWNHTFIDAPARARTPWATMTAADMGDLMAYLQSLRPRP